MKAKKYLIRGSLLFISSTCLLLIPKLHLTAVTITLLWASNWLGIVYLSESITRWLANKSLLALLLKNKKNLLFFAAASVFGGMIIEGAGQWTVVSQCMKGRD